MMVYSVRSSSLRSEPIREHLQWKATGRMPGASVRGASEDEEARWASRAGSEIFSSGCGRGKK